MYAVSAETVHTHTHTHTDNVYLTYFFYNGKIKNHY